MSKQVLGGAASRGTGGSVAKQVGLANQQLWTAPMDIDPDTIATALYVIADFM